MSDLQKDTKQMWQTGGEEEDWQRWVFKKYGWKRESGGKEKVKMERLVVGVGDKL